jgi:hypothetical protein
LIPGDFWDIFEHHFYIKETFSHRRCRYKYDSYGISLL